MTPIFLLFKHFNNKMSLAQTTQSAYERRIKKITDTINCSITDTATVIRAIEAMPIQPNTKKNYFIACHHATKGTPAGEIYKLEFQKKNDEQRKLPMPVAPNITYKQIQEAGEKIMNNESLSLEHRILAGLSTQIAPLRLDCCSLRLFKNIEEIGDYSGNYILLTNESDSKLVIQEHKTAKTMLRHHGSSALIRTLTPGIYKLVEEWAENTTPDDRLLASTPNALGKTITRLFKRFASLIVTQNIIRHAYITQAREGDRPLAVVGALAKKSGSFCSD